MMMKPIMLAAAALALSAAAAAEADPVAVGASPETTVIERDQPATGAVVVEPGATVIERRGPYDSRPEQNSQSRERTPNKGDGTTRSKDANDG